MFFFPWLHAAGDICVSSGLAPLGSVALFTARPSIFRSTREKQSSVHLPGQGPDLRLERRRKERGSRLSPVGSLPGATAEEAAGKSRAHAGGNAALSSERRERIKARGVNNINRKLKAFVLVVSPPLMRLSVVCHFR